MNMKYIGLVLLGILFAAGLGFAFFGPGTLYGNITACGAVINASNITAQGSSNYTIGNFSNTYSVSGTQGANMTVGAGGACIIIVSSNVILDMNGSVIQLANAAGSTPTLIGISITGSNVTVRDGYINVSSNTSANTGAAADAKYIGIDINGSANVTILNVTLNPMSFNKTASVSYGLNISNTPILPGTNGFIRIEAVNISNVTTAGILITNSTNVTIHGASFGAGGSGTWPADIDAVTAFSEANTTAVLRHTNISESLLNQTNVSIFIYGNLSVRLVTSDPIAAGPAGGAVGSTQSYLTYRKAVHFKNGATNSRANLTFWFTNGDISPFSSDQLSVYSTDDDSTWTGPRTTAITGISATLSNLASLDAGIKFSVFGYTLGASGGATSANVASSRADVPNPTLEYSCADRKITVRTQSGLSGGTVRMQYYCGTSACGGCNARNIGAYSATIGSDGSAVFDYFGAGEYQFEVSGLGSSSSTYRETIWYDSGWKCYKPDTACPSTQPAPVAEQVAEQPVPQPEAAEQPSVVEEQPAAPAAEPAAPQPAADQERQNALSAISSADSAISSAQGANRDVGAARQKLQEANNALSSGDYATAAVLANEAAQLAQSAPAKPAAAEPAAPQPEQQPEAPPDNTLLYAGVVVLAIILVAAYMLMAKGKKKGL